MLVLQTEKFNMKKENTKVDESKQAFGME